MKRITDQLLLLDEIPFVNIWVLEVERRRFVLDTGHALERPLLRRALARAGVRKAGDLAAVLLTHRHSDHAGNARWLRDTFRCPVICHRADAGVLSGAEPAPPLARRGAPIGEDLLCRVEDRFPARCPVDDVYGDGAWRWGFEVVPVPGHTAGSVMLYHAPTETLFSGDAILSSPLALRWFVSLRPAVAGFSLDVEACRDEVRRFLQKLPPVGTLSAGHGPPVVTGADHALLGLLSRLGARSHLR
jgi:glyoxylase-like metal-dependent hydrolase (beta-lactamase superfamily II)